LNNNILKLSVFKKITSPFF